MNRMEVFDRARSRNEARTEERGERTGLLDFLRKKLHGEILREGNSSVLVVREMVPWSFRHGDVVFEEVGSIDAAVLPMLFTRNFKPGLRFEELLFFDVETTGLSGGAGTKVFLTGFLRITAEGVSVTQYFLSTLSSEPLYLRHLQEQLKKGRVLVSYNGKAYDYNLIKSRYILNGFPSGDSDPLHLDLLYSSRRLWKGHLPDFTLGTVERMAFGCARPFDIPGWQIPQVYFDYLRGRDVCSDMHLVFLHNRLDLLSLLALLVRQATLLKAGVSGRNTIQGINPATISDMLLKKGYQDEACRILEGHPENNEAMRRLGLIKKRQKKHSQALQLFIALADHARGLDEYLFACTEAAKLCEHVFRDIERALFYAANMRERLGRARILSPESHERFRSWEPSIERRIVRLKSKLLLHTRKVDLADGAGLGVVREAETDTSDQERKSGG